MIYFLISGLGDYMRHCTDHFPRPSEAFGLAVIVILIAFFSFWEIAGTYWWISQGEIIHLPASIGLFIDIIIGLFTIINWVLKKADEDYDRFQ